MLLQPLPYRDAERIVSVETFWTNTGRTSQNVSGPDFLDWRAQNDVFEKMAVYYGNIDNVVVGGDRAVFANEKYVSAHFFAVFGQTASAGRLLTEQDLPAAEVKPAVAVVASHWAETHFGSAEAAIGRTITVYGNAMEIVGVAAPGFRYPGATDIWAPWRTSTTHRNSDNYHAVGKLKPGVDLTRAQAQMRTIGDNLAQQYPENRLKTVSLIPLQERLTGTLQVTLWALMSAVGVVWLIGCANIANLLLARAAGRAREIALRAALGAGRDRVVRQLLTESCVLAGAAGLAGLLLASMLLQALVALSPATLPRIGDVRVDTTVLLFALALSLVSTVLFGLVPALHASRLDLSDALKQGGARGTVSGASTRLRSGLVVAEVALSVILLATAGLLVRSLQALQHVDLGFTTEGVLVAYTEYAVKEDLADVRTRSRFYADVLDRLRAVPVCVRRRAWPTLGWDGSPGRLATISFKAGGRVNRGSGRRPSSTRSRRTISGRWRFRFARGVTSMGPTCRSGRRSPSSTRPWHAPPFQASPPLGSIFGRTAGRRGWRLSGLLRTPGGRIRLCRLHRCSSCRRRRTGATRRRSWPGARWTRSRSQARCARSCTTPIPPCRSGSRPWRTCLRRHWRIRGFARN